MKTTGEGVISFSSSFCYEKFPFSFPMLLIFTPRELQMKSDILRTSQWKRYRCGWKIAQGTLRARGSFWYLLLLVFSWEFPWNFPFFCPKFPRFHSWWAPAELAKCYNVCVSRWKRYRSRSTIAPKNATRRAIVLIHVFILLIFFQEVSIFVPIFLTFHDVNSATAATGLHSATAQRSALTGSFSSCTKSCQIKFRHV